MRTADPINIHDNVDAICRQLDIDPTYVAELNITPTRVTALLFRGKKGRCEGPKYVDETTGKAAMENVHFKVRA